MNNKELKKLIQQWAAEAGAHNVMATLIKRRLSISLVEKLVSGRYPGELRGASREVIENELKKAGVMPSGTRAS
jgi:predicted methyltransferase MtxX (methanogen marker protein 4)